jgi:hypothetical protein
MKFRIHFSSGPLQWDEIEADYFNWDESKSPIIFFKHSPKTGIKQIAYYNKSHITFITELTPEAP